MISLFFVWLPTFSTVATVALIIFLGQYRSISRFRITANHPSRPHIKVARGQSGNAKEICAPNNDENDEADTEEIRAMKLLYYQLHSLEKFPEVLPRARRLLLALLKESSVSAKGLPDHESILSVKSFSRRGLEDFLRWRDKSIGSTWEQYNLRRKEGQPRELFENRENAIWWLKQIAPVKYVDGAWLGHIGKVTAPFALQKTMKGAWQILSEELGDGDLEKNHVHVYHKLLDNLDPNFPTAEVLDFGHPRHQLNELAVWKAALAQLLISLFPNEFLPEILGFNLHFEAISMDTLKAAKELKEVGIDPYYFILHISIDNAHSGHSAIAVEVVCEYMEAIRKVEGHEAAEKAWKKLQAGYLLSSQIPGTVVGRNRKRKSSQNALNHFETDVMKIFTAKAAVVHGIHCSSKVKIGSRSVADWLDPVELESTAWQKGLLDALSNSKYWICRGDSSKSRFMRELQWSGRMFGSFTQDEFDVLTRWIDSLPNLSLALEDVVDDTNAGEVDTQDILSGYPAFQPIAGFFRTTCSSHSTATSFSFQNLPSLYIGTRPIFERFFPLWLAHPCLLQSFVSIPFRTKSTLACTVVRILRAQGGFDIEQECVAGMGEVRRPNSLGLAGIGMNMMSSHGRSPAELPSLKHVLQAWPSEFAVHMLHISMRPLEYRGLLLGMATAFAKMHVMVAKAGPPLLSFEDQDTLQKIAHRELEGLELCWAELKTDENVYAECCKGYLIAGHEIQKCFQI